MQRGRRLLFTILPLALLVGLAELGLRIWFHLLASDDQRQPYALLTEMPEAVRFKPHHYLGYSLQPGYRKGETSHNSHGFRGAEIEVPKPAGTFRIAILGGSTTYTEFVKENAKAFPAQLEQLLQKQLPGQKIEVVNAGVPGYSTWESLGNLCYKVLDLEPDLIICHHGVNDAHCRFVHPDFYRADNSGRRSVWTNPIDVTFLRFSLLSRVVGRHTGLWSHPGIDAFLRAPSCDPGLDGPSDRIGGDPMAVLDQNPPGYFRRNLTSIVGVCKSHGLEVLLTTWAHTPHRGDYVATPHYQRAIEEGKAVVKEVAYQQQVPCFDFAQVMTQEPQFWRDGRHVNEQGARLKAKHFAEFLVPSGLVGTGKPDLVIENDRSVRR